MTPTPAQIAILRDRYPNIGELVLRMNAAALLAQPISAGAGPVEVSPPEKVTGAGPEGNNGHPAPAVPSADRAATATETAQKRKPRASRVPKTRNGGTWTEAQFWGRLRSCLRRMSIYWVPARTALHAARVAAKGPRGRKWLFLCAGCGRAFLRKQVQIDHIEPCGALTDYAHIADFLRRLTPESPSAFAVRCRRCHTAKTNQERGITSPAP